MTAVVGLLLPGLSRKLKAGHSSSSHLDGMACCVNTLSHLLHLDTVGMNLMCLLALRLPFRCGVTCRAGRRMFEK
jgi:hypothetical protein